MAQVINTNLASLAVQRNLASNQGASQTAMERLSTGLRINSAKDDAAGLAISSRMTAQINGLNQAARNAADGISLAQTAEGALGEIANNLQRVRTLAVQSANATNTTADRTALNNEVTQLLAEIDRVADGTKFNGVKLIDGTFSSQTFQVGAESTDTVTIGSITDANIASLGSTTLNNSANLSFNTSALTGFATAVTAGHLSITPGGGSAVSLGAIGAATSIAQRAGQIVEAINAVSSQTGVSAVYDSTAGQVTMSSESTFDVVSGGATGITANVGVTGLTSGGTVNFASTNPTTGITNGNVSSAGAAATMIKLADSALATVNTARGSLGAYQARFESIVANVMTAAENTQASRSRIMDADFAAETAQMTKSQILQQAGISVLSQANAQPQNVLALLQ